MKTTKATCIRECEPVAFACFMSLRVHDGGASAPLQEDSEYGSNMLIPDFPLMVSPRLAEAIGLEEAIVIQQLFWLLRNPKNGRVHNGQRWIFNTVEQWREQYFPFWSESTIQRIFAQLETMMLVESCQPEGKLSRRKYYRLNRGMVKRLQEGRIQKPKKKSKWDKLRFGQVDVIEESSGPNPITETSLIDFEPKETCLATRGEGISLKDLKFQKLKMPKDAPTWEEFEQFLFDNDLWEITDKKDYEAMYQKLHGEKWHKWDGRRWKRIRYWKLYVTSLNERMER